MSIGSWGDPLNQSLTYEEQRGFVDDARTRLMRLEVENPYTVPKGLNTPAVGYLTSLAERIDTAQQQDTVLAEATGVEVYPMPLNAFLQETERDLVLYNESNFAYRSLAVASNFLRDAITAQQEEL